MANSSGSTGSSVVAGGAPLTEGQVRTVISVDRKAYRQTDESYVAVSLCASNGEQLNTVRLSIATRTGDTHNLVLTRETLENLHTVVAFALQSLAKE